MAVTDDSADGVESKVEQRSAPLVGQVAADGAGEGTLQASGTSDVEGDDTATSCGELSEPPSTEFVQVLQTLHQEITVLVRDIRILQRQNAGMTNLTEGNHRALETLYREWQGTRDDLQDRLLRPMLIQLCQLYNDVWKMLQEEPTQPSVTEQRLRRNIQSFLLSIDDILMGYGVTRIQKNDDTFDPLCQRVIGRRPTAEPQHYQRVAERSRHGFQLQGRVLQPEWVYLYEYQATPSAPNQTSDQSAADSPVISTTDAADLATGAQLDDYPTEHANNSSPNDN